LNQLNNNQLIENNIEIFLCGLKVNSEIVLSDDYVDVII